MNNCIYISILGALNRRAAVVRGRVVTRAGRGLVGLRVHTPHKADGVTLTRHDGWFDIMVNGGGAVSLSFSKPPFSIREVSKEI